VTLARAFQLAHSLFRFRKRDRHIALTIVSEAVNAVQVRLIAQIEADRHDPQKPTKVRWNTQQWLQLLIYCKSEAFERQQENDNSPPLTREDMIIRYIKHLILTTSRRNSFHVCLGLTRLAYDYGPSETMAIYDLVFQDPDASTKKSDSYYRGRKNRLLQELTVRFERFVRIEQGMRGEKRFQGDSESTRFAPLIARYLTLFTPWDTSCKLPANLDAWTTIQALQFSQSAQIHSLIHPGCFARITKALKLDDPDRRLALPEFLLEKQESTPPEDDVQEELSGDEASEIKDKIAEHEDRRKRFGGRSLSVRTDGTERARLDLAESSHVCFDIAEDVNLIELVGHDEKGELLMATHLLMQEEDYAPEKRAREYSIVLEGGQKVSLLLLTTPSDGDTANLSVEVIYQEAEATSVVHQRRHPENVLPLRKSGRTTWLGIPLPGFAVALAALALIGGALILYSTLRNGPGERMAGVQQPSSDDPLRIPTPVATPPEPSPTGGRKPSASPSQLSTVTGPTPGNITRDQTIRANKSLVNIQRIHVQSLGTDPFSQRIWQALSEKLQAGNRFAIARSPDDADTALSGSVRQIGSRRNAETGQQVEVGNVNLQLVNVDGNVIWSGRYRGTADQIATRFLMDLLAAIEVEKRSIRGK
jgi:hypothetical protein